MKNTEIKLSADDGSTKISPLIYGHFAEHIGGVIYDGIWVGKNHASHLVRNKRR